MRNKLGMFFTTDATIALSIILVFVLIAFPTTEYFSKSSKLDTDVISVLSSLQVSEVNNSYVKQLIVDGKITHINNSVLEQIAEFYSTDKQLAKDFASSIMQGLDTNENIGIWYENNLIYSKNSSAYESSGNVRVSRQLVTAVKEGENVTGYSSRAFLSSPQKVDYFYFGGYVGDGNISMNLSYLGNLSKATLEFSINKNFTLYVNGVFQGNYDKSVDEYTPVTYSIPTTNFVSGSNLVEFKGNNIGISGGFIKLVYTPEVSYQVGFVKNFLGISGIVNLYDGMYFSNFSSMEIYLHMNTSQNITLEIGNVTVFNNTASSIVPISLNNSYLSSVLNYSSIYNKNIPIRLGFENLTSSGNFNGSADVILITDTSGSMDDKLSDDNTGTARNCSDVNLNNADTKRISLAKCVDKTFIATLLSGVGNRVGLVAFSDSANNYLNLTNNQTLLNATINAYGAAGTTCISCAINRAYNMLSAQSNNNRSKYILVMTDGATGTRSTVVCDVLNGIEKSDSFKYISGDEGGYINYFSSQNWTDYRSGSGTNAYSISGLNDSFAFSTGASGNFYNWDGSQWISAQSLGNNIYGVDLLNSSYGLAVGDSGKIYSFNGTAWKEINDTGSQQYRGVSVLNATNSLVVGTAGNLLSKDSSDWVIANVGAVNFYDVKYLNSSFAFAVGSAGKVYLWNGSSWLQYQDTGSQTWRSISVVNSSYVLTAGSGGAIYYWNGSNFTNFGSPTAQQINGISFSNSSSGTIVTSNALIYDYSNGVWSLGRDARITGVSTTGLGCGDSYTCGTTYSNDLAAQNANWSSCRANTDLNATVHTVGFGPVATCALASTTLQAISACGNGSYFASSNATLLNQFYQQLANAIVNISYVGQTSQVSGNFSSILYPDSYIKLNYSSSQFPFGLVLTLEQNFTNSTDASFSIPANSSLISAEVLSYSGPRWSTNLFANSTNFYNLSGFANAYTLLGDPFVFRIYDSLIGTNNQIKLFTGWAPQNSSMSGSIYNKVIYSVLKNISSYTGLRNSAEGCNWLVQFEDGTNISFSVPDDYVGPNSCQYSSSLVSYDSNDAFQLAVYLLLSAMDFNSNNKIDFKFSESEINISSSKISGIPYVLTNNVEVRTWN